MSSVPPPADRRPGFAELDEALTSGAAGVLIVTVRDEERDALLAHVARRLRAGGYEIIRAAPSPSVALFAEVATQLGLDVAPTHGVRRLAAAIAETNDRLSILGSLPEAGSWDADVLECLVALGCLAVLTASSTLAAVGHAPSTGITYDVTSGLDAGDKLRWVAAVVESSAPLAGDIDLKRLEAWWHRSDGASGPTAPLSTEALEIATMLSLAGRSLPMSAFDGDVHASLLEGLRSSAFLVPCAHALVLAPGVDHTAAARGGSPGLCERTAAALQRAPFDPWALARAAELLLPYRPLDADASMDHALRAASDRRIVAELDARWHALVAASLDPNLELCLRGAERALTRSAAHDALRWCASAAELARPDARLSILMAKAHTQLGDLVSARVLLESLARTETDPEVRAAIAVEESEIGYLTGDHALADERARSALQTASTPKVRLGARNVIGKILLARGEWDAANSHFAEDAMAGHAAGDTTAELRARLNRGIALLSKGLLEEAHRAFAEVRRDAERSGDARGVAFALSNLGLVAYRRRDYASALEHWEASIKYAEAFEGGHSVANLAELRLRLGLVDNAEQAVRFGRRASAGGLPPLRAAQFELVAAQVALARGFSDVAHAEVSSAVLHARAAGDLDFEGAIAIVGARIAVADGDLHGAREWLANASAKVKAARSVAELALLRAVVLRAAGEPALVAAQEALALARSAAEDDLLIDVHTLVATCARDERDFDTAVTHCQRAGGIRDRIALTLASDVRDAFLGKPEMGALARLEQSLLSTAAPPESEPDRRAEGVPESQRTAPSVEIVGGSERMRALLTTLERAAATDANILVHGESGTGKELVARAVHAASARSQGPLVTVNCAALVETLLLSELFGHEKGAFTGASARRRGRFELAAGGTLFLDEIGDISARTQVALLRVLQEKTFERVGGGTTLRADVRVVCATHRDLRAMVERGEFREDLYYRIRGITLVVPPLRARREDIPAVASHLLGRICAEQRRPRPLTLDAKALDLLSRHRWPGNVRELENVLRAAAVFAPGETITRNDLVEASAELEQIEEAPSSSARQAPAERTVTVAAYAHVREHRISLHDMKREIERACIIRALAEANGSITRAAELLGMKRPRVSQLIKQYGLTAASTEES